MITHAIVVAILSNKIISLLLEHNLTSQGEDFFLLYISLKSKKDNAYNLISVMKNSLSIDYVLR